jgi:hypothetical protein
MGCATDLRRCGFRTADQHWVYLGFCCLAAAALISASIVGWKFDGRLAERAIPGNELEGSALVVTVMDIWSVELKVLEYVALFATGLVLFVCYVMAAK